MSMEDWPDNRLDDLFRKSAEEYDAPFDPADWADMSRRLDEHDRQSWFDRISRWGGIGALLSLLLGGVGWVVHDPTVDRSHQQTTAISAKSASNVVKRPAEASHKINSTASKLVDRQLVRSESVESQPKADQSVAGQSVPARPVREQGGDEVVVAESIASRVSAVRRLNPPAMGNNVVVANRKTIKPTKSLRYVTRVRRPGLTVVQPAASEPMTDGAGKKQVRYGGTLAAENRSAGTLSLTEVPLPKAGKWSAGSVVNPEYTPVGPNRTEKKEAVAGYAAVSEAAVASEPMPWLSAVSPINSLTQLVVTNRPMSAPALTEIATASPARRAMPRLTGLSVMLFAAPDLSTIGLKNFDRPGSNLGAAIQYQLTDRLSINAGAMYSVKRYQSYADDYVLPWKWEVLPTEVQGVCTMIDVPVNVRYDWLLRPRGDGRAPARWFVSAGATSYFVQRETYTYDYEDPANPKIKGWGWDNRRAGKPGGTFGFSNLNVSVGYERPITNRLSWQVEPFMKIPLREVGFFKVRLVSTGAFVGLRYRL